MNPYEGKARGGRRREKPLAPDPAQLLLHQQQQRQIIRECEPLDRSHKVSATILKALLRAIFNRANEARAIECSLSLDDLASEIGLRGRRQLRRAIKVLSQDLSVLCVWRDASTGQSVYRIVWNELALLCPSAGPRAAEWETAVQTANGDA